MSQSRLRWVVASFFAALVVGASALVALSSLPGPTRLSAASAEASSQPKQMSPAEVEAVERVVRDYLMRNPEVILEALKSLEARGAERMAAAQREAVTERRDELLNDAAAPVTGNPDGAITIVEFFDYQCPYCKRVAADLIETVNAEGDVRLVFKEYPILGPVSDFAAKAALAAHKQGKYLEFHDALMTSQGKLTEQSVLDIAEGSGLDLDRLRKDMKAPEIAQALDRNHALAEALQVRGTPAFVIGDQVIPGAIGMDQMRQLIEAERSS